jgi:SAM-dependent methyltransferase
MGQTDPYTEVETATAVAPGADDGLAAILAEKSVMTTLAWLYYRQSCVIADVSRSVPPPGHPPYDQHATESIILLIRDRGITAVIEHLESLRVEQLVSSEREGVYAITERGRRVAYAFVEYENQVAGGQLRHLLPLLQLKEGGLVVDIGCGAGQTLAAIGQQVSCRRIGVDASAADLDLARAFQPVYGAGSGAEFMVGDAYHVPIMSGDCDAVVTILVSLYLRRQAFLDEVCRILRPGGRFLLISIGPDYPLARIQAGLRKRTLDKVGPFMLLNGLLLHLTGRQITFRGRSHIFETAGGLRRDLRRAGMRVVAQGRTNMPFRLRQSLYVVAEKIG